MPYDGIDQDCRNGDRIDVDEDGWIGAPAGGADCDDANPALHPTAVDSCEDGVDADCADGDPDCPPLAQDADRDGHAPTSAGGDDCDDARSDVNPDEVERPLDGVDQNCDGDDRLFAAPLETVDLPPGAFLATEGVVWAGDRYLAIWFREKDWGALPLDRAGRPIGEPTTVETLPNPISMAWAIGDGARVMVVCQEEVTERTTTRVLAAGAVVGPATSSATRRSAPRCSAPTTASSCSAGTTRKRGWTCSPRPAR